MNNLDKQFVEYIVWHRLPSNHIYKSHFCSNSFTKFMNSLADDSIIALKLMNTVPKLMMYQENFLNNIVLDDVKDIIFEMKKVEENNDILLKI
jgi:hypothetical protein